MTLALACAAMWMGCSDPLGLEGDWTDGERRRTEWQIADGLCPGLGGGCALDVPLAVGAEPRLRMRGQDPTDRTITGSGAVEVASFGTVEIDGEPQGDIALRAVAPGEGVVALSGPEGEIDRVRLRVRAATELRCGVVPEGQPLLWDMSNLAERDAITLAAATETTQVACRAIDGDGALMTVRAISWEAEGSTIELFEDFVGDPGTGRTAVRGARIRARGLEPGETVLRARLGEVTRELAITVE